MDNEILFYAASYVTARMAIVLGFGYALFRVFRPDRVRVRASHGRLTNAHRADLVADDRC